MYKRQADLFTRVERLGYLIGNRTLVVEQQEFKCLFISKIQFVVLRNAVRWKEKGEIASHLDYKRL